MGEIKQGLAEPTPWGWEKDPVGLWLDKQPAVLRAGREGSRPRGGKCKGPVAGMSVVLEGQRDKASEYADVTREARPGPDHFRPCRPLRGTGFSLRGSGCTGGSEAVGKAGP